MNQLIAGGLIGLGEAGKQIHALNLEQMREDSQNARQAALILAESMRQGAGFEHDKTMVGVREQSEKGLISYRNRNREEIGRSITDASKPVEETWASEEGDYKTTRTPTRAEAFAAGERRAMELGDFEGAEHLRKTRAPNTAKLGQDDTIINTDTGQVLYQNTAGAERRTTERGQKHEDRLAELRIEYQLKAGLERFKNKNGEGAATALMKNVNFLVENGIAADETEAFNKLRTATEKSEGEAITGLMGKLVQNPSYRGRAGALKAREDATAMVREIRGAGSGDSSESPSRPSSFLSADDVRSAYKAGKIDRPSAVRELGRFGFDAR